MPSVDVMDLVVDLVACPCGVAGPVFATLRRCAVFTACCLAAVFAAALHTKEEGGKRGRGAGVDCQRISVIEAAISI